MAKTGFDNSPLRLAKDKEELKASILTRIQQGEALAQTVVSTKEEKDKLEAEFKAWNQVNYEMIATAFTVRRHAHEHGYVYQPLIDVDSLYGNHHKASLREEIEELKGAFTTQLGKLRRFHEMIDLQQVAPGVQRSAPSSEKSDLERLLFLLGKFHRVAQKLRDRYDGRETLTITDEYDVQDLLFSMLHVDFDDIRKEEYSPSHAGGNSRIDIVLKTSDIIIEVKMATAKLKDKQLGDELLVDIGRYKEYPGAKRFVIFIYDRGDYVSNKRGMVRDLEKQSTPNFSVRVVINPE